MDEVLALAVEIEGHPDNVTPALLGGCQIVVQDGERLVTSPVALARDLWAVLYIPSQQMPTQQARGLLGPTVSRGDAVFNMGRAALLVNALSSGDISLLRTATQDRMHQPARGVLFPRHGAHHSSGVGGRRRLGRSCQAQARQSWR